MKNIITLILCIWFCQTKAANYYFSSSIGDDSRSALQALNANTPWKTIGQLNSYMGNLQPGDSVLFKKNDIFFGSINVVKSGTNGKPIVFGAYGTGAKPIITGFTQVGNWINLGGNIWESTNSVSALPTCNIVVINGVNTPMGRYPNSDYLTIQTHSGSTSITNSTLSGANSWLGAELVIRSNRWTLDRTTILGHSGNKLTFNPTSYQPINGFGFFIQNSNETLDLQNEWYYNSNTKKLRMFSVSRPTNVQLAAVETLIFTNGSYLVFENLALQGGNGYGFASNSPARSKVIIQNCEINFIGRDAISQTDLSDFSLQNSLITNINNCAVKLYYQNPRANIQNNMIQNTGVFPGMGQSDIGGYCAIYTNGPGTIIESNKIVATGNNGIDFTGDYSAFIKNNFVDTFAFVLDDGGGIYTWKGNASSSATSQQSIINNIVLNGIGAGKGTDNPTYSAADGIYADDNSANINILQNTVANCSNWGIFLHNAHDLKILENTCYNNKSQLTITHDNILPTAPIRNIILRKNKFVSKTIGQAVAKIETLDNDIVFFGQADSNYYARPLDDLYTIFVKPTPTVGISQSLSSWRHTYSKDFNSRNSPKTISEYILNSLKSQNKVLNGTFSSNISGADCWNQLGNCTLSWDNTGKINGRSLKLSYSNGSNGNSFIIIGIGAIKANADYILRYSVRGMVSNKSVGTYLRQTNDSFKVLSATRYTSLTNTITDHEVLLSSSKDESNASIVFEVNNADGTLWLDNIELYEADVNKTNPDNFIRFEYNPTNVSKTIALNGMYTGIDSTIFYNEVSLAPYTSVILIKSKENISLPMQFLSFEGAEKETNVELNWKTANASNTDFFEILRSADGLSFNEIGRVSNYTPTIFSFTSTDFHPLIGKNYYRLKQVERDGKYSYSKTIVISFPKSTASLQINPNPATDKILVSLLPSLEVENSFLLIKNVLGIVVQRVSFSSSKGKKIIDISSLPKGTYFVSLILNEYSITKKFVRR